GYGLTLGVHTRIDETIAQVTGSANVGNLYVNRNMVGAVVGVHTRIDETIAQVTGSANVGNLYVNRNMVGAVVGVQPFGGEG
ncbi:hypothetical protein CWN49_38860, partial [Klebsiella michiganensis]